MKISRFEVAEALARFDRQEPSIDAEIRRHAAVALVLAPDPASGVLGLYLTRRSGALRTHKGQWALPGGRIDQGETHRQAALRELHEEIGLELGEDTIVGELDDYLTRSGYRMTPVVMWAGSGFPEPVPNEDEVASVHHLSLTDLDVDAKFVTIPESSRPVIQLPLFGSLLHAPTAAILYQLREIVLHGRSTRVSHFEQPVFAWR